MFAGRVTELWRYPIKSFAGERLERAEAGPDGIPGDRGLALFDVGTGRALSAKRVPDLLAARIEGSDLILPSEVRISMDDPSIDDVLSAWVGRAVHLAQNNGNGRQEIEGEDDRVFRGRAGGLHDSSPVHLVTTATLVHLTDLYPEGRFDARRFRPNIVVGTAEGLSGLVERSWLGRSLKIGSAVFEVTKACSRCVVTTLAQEDLPQDKGILRTVARRADNQVGVYARAIEVGEIAVGDVVDVTPNGALF